ncbi:hypothetical protein HN419_05760 [Candidatus Woesearchaeota archaeon]|jgi:uncharacterized membrane protein|nr:hypothetical protein [Candidatus Woesearchaeota archaeon]MBT7928776.1 hypothetical protein [Candidatus Peregrinibacteria bacterium]MBT3537624.1 hypothetical protein [Candidatus Woesearchaeota archaeon]MBT4698442.1 hypothetical protein [Candidatus Woesearchaeota archaeon]MBT4716649.1 hypothetical protein [Candidatus Woesearchaeota archaeon]
MKSRYFLAILAILVLVLFTQQVFAAKVSGTLYDAGLEIVPKAIVEVNSEPYQRIVVTEGTYEVMLSPGTYIIATRSSLDDELSATENITITTEGEFVLDLFLLPEIDFGVDELEYVVEEVQEPLSQPKDDRFEFSITKILLTIVWIGALVVIVFAFVRTKNGKNKGFDDELGQVINFIKRSGKRVTQKELRKEFPLSEAKISLIVSELESKGIVEKIKKGRSNIIVLKKR